MIIKKEPRISGNLKKKYPLSWFNIKNVFNLILNCPLFKTVLSCVMTSLFGVNWRQFYLTKDNTELKKALKAKVKVPGDTFSIQDRKIRTQGRRFTNNFFLPVAEILAFLRKEEEEEEKSDHL